jgi:hypothetical protein
LPKTDLHSVGDVEVAYRDAYKFGEADSSVVEEPRDRGVAAVLEPLPVARGHQLTDVVLVQNVRRVEWHTRRLHVAHGVAALRDLAFLLAPREELTDAVLVVLRRRGRITPLVQHPIKKRLHVLARDAVGGPRHTALGEMAVEEPDHVEVQTVVCTRLVARGITANSGRNTEIAFGASARVSTARAVNSSRARKS